MDKDVIFVYLDLIFRQKRQLQLPNQNYKN